MDDIIISSIADGIISVNSISINSEFIKFKIVLMNVVVYVYLNR